jgi:uncharacterized protein YegL
MIEPLSPPQLNAALEVGLAQIARRQLHVVLLLDCSGSMQGEKIASLNYAIRSALPELRQVAKENPEVAVLLSALCFGSTAYWHIQTPTAIAQVEWSDLKAGGETALGAALEQTAVMLTAASAQARLLPPVIVLVSDGYPTDDIETGFRLLFAQKAALAATRLSIAIGENVDMTILERFMDTPGAYLKPLYANSAPDLVRHIKWATTVPVKSISSPVLEPDPRQRLVNEVEQQNHANTKLVW